MPQMKKISKNNTSKVGKPQDTYQKVTLHSTDIFTRVNNVITLNHGGYKTQTTKNRLNQIANEYDLPYNVFQNKGLWFVNVKDKVISWDTQYITFKV